MDINSSGTGGAEDGNLKVLNDESEVADDTGLNNSAGMDDSTHHINKKGKKVGGNSGQIMTKEHNMTGDDTAGGTNTNSTSGNKNSNSKSMLI